MNPQESSGIIRNPYTWVFITWLACPGPSVVLLVNDHVIIIGGGGRVQKLTKAQKCSRNGSPWLENHFWPVRSACFFDIRLMVAFSVKITKNTKIKKYKNTKMFTKWVAVARKSVLTIAFCAIFRGAPHGDVRFGQNHHFWPVMNILFFRIFKDLLP